MAATPRFMPQIDITPERARQELARRSGAQNENPYGGITKEEAQQELDRRKSAADSLTEARKPSLAKIGDFLQSVARGAAQPFIDTGIGAAMGGDKAMQSTAHQGFPSMQQVSANLIGGAGNWLMDKVGAPHIGKLNPVDIASNSPDPTVAALAGIGSSFAMPMLKPLQAVGAVGKMARLGDLAATGAGYAGTMAAGKGEDVGDSAILGALLPLGIHSAVNAPLVGAKSLAKGVLRGIEKASGRTGSGVKTPSELADVLPALHGTEIPIQFATNAGHLKNLANELASIPFSGVVNPAQTAVHKTDELADAVYNSLGGHISPAEANPIIHEALNRAERAVTAKSRKLYTNLADEAEAKGVKGSIPGLQAEADNVLTNYEQAPIKEAHPLYEEPFLRNLLGSFRKGFIPDMEKEYMLGGDSPAHGLMDMVNAQQAIGKYYGRVKSQQGKDAASGLAENLYRIASEDIENATTATGDENLINMLNLAKNHYKEHVMPYRESGMKKKLFETNTADIASTIMNPQNQGSSILNHLPTPVRNVILSQALQPAVNANVEDAAFNTTPHKLISKYAELKKKNPTAFDMLVSPEVQQSFKSLNDLHEATNGLRPIARKPETGIQVKPILYGAGLAGLAHSGASAAGLSNPVSLLAAPALALGNRAFHGLLRDPKLLEAYAAGKGVKQENILNQLFGGKKSKAIKGAANILSNPGALAAMITNMEGQ